MTIRVPMAAVIAEGSVREIRVDARRLPKASGGRIGLRPMDWYRLLGPYLSVRFRDQCRAVAPVAAYLALFQFLILRRGIDDAATITAGLVAVVVGLALFLEGLKLGMMPFGQALGTALPTRAPLALVLLVTFALGVAVTFAEPAVGALQAAGAVVNPTEKPLLHALLGRHATWLVLAVGSGVGVAAVIGTLRFVNGWSLKPLIVATCVPTLALTAAFAFHPPLASVIGLAWDCGAVTTGPVTVPLVLALGIGVATSAGRGDAPLAGFGIVTLASLLPVLAVLLLGAGFAIAGGDVTAGVARGEAPPAWHAESPWAETVLGARAVLPLAAVLLVLLRFVARERLKQPRTIALGVCLATSGMILFNLGLTHGLSLLGGQSGGLVPGTFARVEGMPASPLWPGAVGVAVAVLFAGALGFGATLAEPALAALGATVENLTSGALRRRSLVNAVALGVAAGLALGALRHAFDLPLALLLVPSYALALGLTAVSTEEFVNVAWDSAGVTTGPVTVPLVLALGLGFGDALGLADGFGLLALASVGPVVSVLGAGLLAGTRARRRARARARATVAAAAGAGP